VTKSVYNVEQRTRFDILLIACILLQHDPCEEYIEGLTAQPWWDASQFEWVAGLEV
jgi:hypothetical protein